MAEDDLKIHLADMIINRDHIVEDAQKQLKELDEEIASLKHDIKLGL